jgi:DNA-binding transcriptional MerR regulator
MEQKSPDAFRTISEVAEWLGVPTHVLRFWESRFTQVKPVKRAGGRRYYRPSDMELLGGIRKLLHDDGMTIRGVQKLLREEGVKHVAAMSPPLDLGAGDEGEPSNVVSLDSGRRTADTSIEDAEVVGDSAGSVDALETRDEDSPAVDEAMEDGTLAPVDPEEDRPVTFGTDAPAAEETERHAPHLSDETPPQDDPLTEDPAEEIEATPGEDPLAAETSQDPEGVEAPLAPPAPDATQPDHSPYGTWASEDEPSAPTGIASAGLPHEDPLDTDPAETNTPSEAPADTDPTPAPDWNPAIEVSDSDDSDILPEPEEPAPPSETPHISRADPTPEMHGEPGSASGTADHAGNVFGDDDGYAPPDADWDVPEADSAPASDTPPEASNAEADETPDWERPVPDSPLPEEVSAASTEGTVPATGLDGPSGEETAGQAPGVTEDGAYTPVLVMPDLPDDPADGALPPEIAPVAPRLRMLRAHHPSLPAATLRALADRLETLRSEHDGTTLH